VSFSVATLITDCVLDALNAADLASLTFWDTTSLYNWADEAAMRASRLAALFVDRDTSVTLTPGTATYTNPDRHVALLHFALAGLRLVPSTTRELMALSDSPDSDSGTPKRWVTDHKGHDLFRLWPTPNAGGTLAIVVARYPQAITSGAPTVTAPTVFGDYLALRIIAEARRKEGDGSLPEIADAFDQRAALYEQVFADYWGAQ
jgi:hypothetical protein